VKFIDGLTNLAAYTPDRFPSEVLMQFISKGESSFPRSIMIKMSALWTLSTLHFGLARPA
jgi:hypothetical protein